MVHCPAQRLPAVSPVLSLTDRVAPGSWEQHGQRSRPHSDNRHSRAEMAVDSWVQGELRPTGATCPGLAHGSRYHTEVRAPHWPWAMQ